LPANLLESELFGHEKGAFTGAIATRIGAFEEASSGTVFLDEISEMPLELQSKLLGVLENHEIRRLGSTIQRPADVRVIAATNRDLRTEVSRRQFREVPYYRIAVVKITLPPLRERLDDLPFLVEGLLVRAFAWAHGHVQRGDRSHHDRRALAILARRSLAGQHPRAEKSA
jgi:transcriptional regulator with GAF, ATPase, and Fis domain